MLQVGKIEAVSVVMNHFFSPATKMGECLKQQENALLMQKNTTSEIAFSWMVIQKPLLKDPFSIRMVYGANQIKMGFLPEKTRGFNIKKE